MDTTEFLKQVPINMLDEQQLKQLRSKRLKEIEEARVKKDEAIREWYKLVKELTDINSVLEGKEKGVYPR